MDICELLSLPQRNVDVTAKRYVSGANDYIYTYILIICDRYLYGTCMFSAPQNSRLPIFLCIYNAPLDETRLCATGCKLKFLFVASLRDVLRWFLCEYMQNIQARSMRKYFFMVVFFYRHVWRLCLLSNACSYYFDIAKSRKNDISSPQHKHADRTKEPDPVHHNIHASLWYADIIQIFPPLGARAKKTNPRTQYRTSYIAHKTNFLFLVQK